MKSFLQPFAESGQAVGAEDIKAYFEKLRGDEQGMRSAQTLIGGGDGGGDNAGDSRKEQSGECDPWLPDQSGNLAILPISGLIGSSGADLANLGY